MIQNPLLACKENLNVTWSQIVRTTGLARYSLYQWASKTDPKEVLKMSLFTHLTLFNTLGVDFLGWYQRSYMNKPLTKSQLKELRKKINKD